MTQHEVITAGNAMAAELLDFAEAMIEASGDPSDGDHVRGLVVRWRNALAGRPAHTRGIEEPVFHSPSQERIHAA